ncbi:YaiI/YqxD family protein [bacterium]|nr:MAG: YaiI/YqxD family protein [bacterium]
MLDIYIDADGCPVKDETYKVAQRHGLVVYVVSNRPLKTPFDQKIRPVVVGNRFDEADDYIAQNAGDCDIVITADIPLAARAIEKGALVLTPKGQERDEESIGAALATRELLDGLRQMGEMTGGPPPMTQRDRSAFLCALHELVERVKRARKS